jgi:hypothetical protein
LGSFPASTTSWSEYFSFSMQHSNVGNPSRMCNSTIIVSGFLREDRAIGYLPFFCCWLEVPASIYLLPTSRSSWPVISSTRPSCCCTVSSLVVLGTFASVYSIPWSLSCWAPSTVTVSGGFPMLCVGCPCVLLVGLTSMADAIGPFLSSTIGIGSTSASKGEGIVSTSTNPSCYLVSFLASTTSCGAQLLRVFLPSWLGAPLFGGSIVVTCYFMSTKPSLVRSRLFANSLPLYVIYFSATSRFPNESYVSRVSPLYRQVMKLLREYYPTLISLMVLYV